MIVSPQVVDDERFIHYAVLSVMVTLPLPSSFRTFPYVSNFVSFIGLQEISHQSLQKNLLRYISRRKPCKYLLFIQSGILALLIGFFVPVMLLLDKSKELCDRQCGSSAYIVLRYENSFASKKESTCPSLIQTIPCHEKPVQCGRKVQLRQCPGVNGAYLLRNISITPLTIIKVPLLDITAMKGKIVSAMELFAVCPRCRIYSFSYKKSNGICYRQLETVREGWPEQYRICDSEVISENNACNPYDAS